jgi:hypothetical protein
VEVSDTDIAVEVAADTAGVAGADTAAVARAETAVAVEFVDTVVGRTETPRSPEGEGDSRNGLEVERARNPGGRNIVGEAEGVVGTPAGPPPCSTPAEVVTAAGRAVVHPSFEGPMVVPWVGFETTKGKDVPVGTMVRVLVAVAEGPGLHLPSSPRRGILMGGGGEAPLRRGEVTRTRLTSNWCGVQSCGGRCLVHEALLEG